MDDANTLYNKSLVHSGQDGHPIDYAEAFSLNARAAALGLPDAILAMGWFHFNGCGTPPDLRSAERWYRRSARLGEPKAMFSLGQIACDEALFDVAHRWFELARKHGHVRSVYWLGKLHWRGQGVPRDRAKAMKLFEQAAHSHDPEALRLMRFMNRRRNQPGSARPAAEIKPENTKRSPLDVIGVDLGISTDETIEFIRDGRKQFQVRNALVRI